MEVTTQRGGCAQGRWHSSQSTKEIRDKVFFKRKSRYIIVADVRYKTMIFKNFEFIADILVILHKIGKDDSIVRIPEGHSLRQDNEFSTERMRLQIISHFLEQLRHHLFDAIPFVAL